MNFDLELAELEKSVTASDLENDPELLEELKSLGYFDEKVAPKNNPPTKVTSKLIETKSNSVPSIKKVKNDSSEMFSLDDSEMSLTAEDENDEELLEAFNNIQRELNHGNNIENEAQITFNQSETKKSDKVSQVLASNQTLPNDQSINSVFIGVQENFAESKSNYSTSGGSANISAANAARQQAAKLKKEGRIEEALQFLRKAKMLEKGEEIKPEKKNPTINKPKSIAPPSSDSKGSSSSSVTIATASSTASGDIFAPLEKALVESANSALAAAKDAKARGLAEHAKVSLSAYKKYEQELGVLRARRARNQELLRASSSSFSPSLCVPPLFQWRTERREVVVEETDVARDALRIKIARAQGLQSFLAQTSYRQVVLDWRLEGKEREAQKEIEKEGERSGQLRAALNTQGEVVFEEVLDLPGLVRLPKPSTTKPSNSSSNSSSSSSSLANASLSRRRVFLSLSLPRGLLFSPLPLGAITVPLKPLFDHCVTGGRFTLTSPSSSSSSSSSVSLEVTVSVRCPLSGRPEVRVEENRILEVGTWQSENEMNAQTQRETHKEKESNNVVNEKSKANENKVERKSESKTENKISEGKTENKVERVSEKEISDDEIPEEERADPMSVSLLLSNDVLEAEKQELKNALALLAKKSKVSGEDDLSDELCVRARLSLVESRLSLLERSVQSGAIQMEDYLAMLRERVARDSLLLSWARARGRRAQRARTEAKDGEKKEELLLEVQTAGRWAEHIERRLEIMQREISGAEEA